MHLKRRVVSLFMASLLSVTLSPTTHAYSDAESSWAAEIIEKAGAYGLMEGYPDGRFGVGDDMTRAQFVTVLCRLFGWEPEPEQPTSIHRDCNGHWADPYIRAAARYGGVEDHGGLFRPDDYISRMEMAKMLVTALGYGDLAQSLAGAGLPFPDVTEDKGYAAIAYDLGLLTGVEELGQLRFLPEFSAPREQCAAILVRCYERYTSHTDWLHGFYAFSSYDQLSLADAMDGVSVGWARLEPHPDTGLPTVNQTAENNNDWVKPQQSQLVTDYLSERSIPHSLNVFATASAFASCTVDADCQALALALLQTAAAPYSGLTIDFEGLKSDQRDAFTAFMTALRAALPPDQTLAVCVQPDTWFGGYDYRALGEVCDRVILMAHDYQWTEIPDYYLGTANTYSPVTPLPQVYTALKHITDAETGVRDRSKLALQISFGTAGFQVDENGLLLDRTIYHPAKDTIAQRLSQPDTVRTWDAVSHNPYIEYTAEDGRHYKLWYEDAQSVGDKLRLARMFGITGVSVWRLGTIPNFPSLPYYDVWRVFSQR